ncbi:MAG: hypothetical protein WD009_12100 [Phycisphaeraceae bacterium]
MPTITIIGAASTTFGPKVLCDLVNHPQLAGSTVRLVDTNEQRLAIYHRLARRVLEHVPHGYQLEATTDRRAALPGSDYVLIAVDIRHHELWQQDFAIPVKHGIRQVTGELGGPGGLFHSLRQIPLHLEIARDVAELAPRAMTLVMSNPLNRICLAMHRHVPGLGQVVGLCHGVEITHQFVFSRILDIDAEDIESTAAGTNHFTWILDLRRKSTGEDLYPAARQNMARLDASRECLSRKLFDIYDYYPACGDGHMGEYVPYAHEYVGLDGPPFDRARQAETDRWRHLGEIAKERETPGKAETAPFAEFLRPRSWVDTLAFPIMAAATTNALHRMPAVNVLNRGTIANLPADVFIEAPGVVDASGLRALSIGDLPPQLAPFNRRDIDQTELTVEAAVTGDRRRVMQAMLLDPVVDSVNGAERVVDEMLTTQAPYLPQF